jgi:hypothetical protein
MLDTSLDAVHQRLISGHAQINSTLRVFIILIKPVMDTLGTQDGGHGFSQRLIRAAMRDEDSFSRRQDGKVRR